MKSETINIEEVLIKMSKPEIKNLQHENLLSDAIANSKEKAALSFWWIIIPIYVLAAYWMKSFFMPGSSFPSNLGELAGRNSYAANLIFVLVPIILIVTNMMSIKKLYFFSGSYPTLKFLLSGAAHIITVIISIIVMLVYLI